MRLAPVLVPIFLVAGALSLVACGSTGTAEGGGGGGGDPEADAEALANAPVVTGDHQVLIRTWDPRDATRPPTTAALVNKSSDAGRRLSTGQATSTIVRVLGDQEMGALLQILDEKGFSANATAGVTLEGLRPDSRRRGVIIVEDNGATKGIEFFPNMAGTAIPKVFTECKPIIFGWHAASEGLEVRASSTTGTEDPSRTFQAPPIRMPNR